MIGSRLGGYARRPLGRLVLLVGLAVLVVAHLAGAVHRSGTTGPHFTVAGAPCHHEAAGASAPGHEGDDGGEHIDHGVDRPRAQDADAPAQDVTALPQPDAALDHVVRCGPCRPAPSEAADGRTRLVRHCVLRQ
ncbi:hypothetical protein [Streptomyces sp. NPDC048057]|uniref:hypothetical protein n=1 Tax=Streptomyces sp. NPDC048057 TaxID=3155628 RepID=UPI0034081C61